MNEHASDASETRGAKARAWIARLASGAMTEDGVAELKRWISADPRNRAAYLHERSTWQDLAAIENAFGSHAPQAAPRRRSPGRALAFAAIAAAAAWFAVPSAWLWLQTDEASARGEMRDFALDDGSRVMLDSDSAIAVDYSKEARDIRLLKGRAWFDVKHGDARPFRVVVGKGSVRDIGTAFEVDRVSAQTDVAVTDGIVAVESGGAAPLRLTTGERARFAQEGVPHRLAPLAADRIAGWRKGELLLRGVTLDEAVSALARYRKGPVLTLGALSDGHPISGSFRTDRPDEALQTLAAMRGLEQARLPGGVLILRRGKGR